MSQDLQYSTSYLYTQQKFKSFTCEDAANFARKQSIQFNSAKEWQ